jgi:2-iminobutanoate/2-iminopropanoate deaminase
MNDQTVASRPRSGDRHAVLTATAPAPIGPYSQAVRVGDDVYCSGQIPLDPVTGALVPGDARAQTQRVLENLGAVLSAAGLDFSNVVKTTIFLNEAYEAVFGDSKPARSTVAVAALPRDARVEIDCIACK